MPGTTDLFTPATRAWLASRFPAPTAVQARGWPILAAGRHALLIAPTGSGKTLAAFLAAIDRLGRRPAGAPKGVRVLYVSPLKALVADIERNLRAPIAGIAAEAATAAGARGETHDLGDLDGAAKFRPPRVAIRTGDSTPRERRLQSRDPAEILVTTPESLYLLLGSASARDPAHRPDRSSSTRSTRSPTEARRPSRALSRTRRPRCSGRPTRSGSGSRPPCARRRRSRASSAATATSRSSTPAPALRWTSASRSVCPSPT
jgi:ATP-dependent Lhr-like helicase